jgi:hypothetical protein
MAGASTGDVRCLRPRMDTKSTADVGAIDRAQVTGPSPEEEGLVMGIMLPPS